MKFAPNLFFKTILIAAIGMICLIACEDTEKKTTTYGDVLTSTDASAACSCESSWFPHSQTPPPEEGKGSPFDVASTTNCIFHQWSWQKFLWLTKPQNGNPLFLSQMILVGPTMKVVSPKLGLDLVLDSIKQAGSKGILRTNAGYNPDHNSADTVYYSIFVDSTMFQATQSYGDSIKNGLLPSNNSKTFPVNSLELKVAWVNVNSIPASEQDSYYTTEAAVLQANGKYASKTVALLGMHVVGVVINHPEFIWATFEHHDMAPLFNWKTANVSSDTNQLLYAKGTASDLGGITWNGTAPKTPDQVYTLFQFGIPMTATDTFMKTSQSEPENYNNIVSIDSCVAANLGDVWNNYYYKGSLWINTDSLSPVQQADTLVALAANLHNVEFGDIPRGCVSNSNLTMETYDQTFASSIANIKVSNLANCFSCHSAQSYASGNPVSPLYISHVFEGYLSSSQGKTVTEIERLKLKQYLELRRRMSAR